MTAALGTITVSTAALKIALTEARKQLERDFIRDINSIAHFYRGDRVFPVFGRKLTEDEILHKAKTNYSNTRMRDHCQHIRAKLTMLAKMAAAPGVTAIELTDEAFALIGKYLPEPTDA